MWFRLGILAAALVVVTPGPAVFAASGDELLYQVSVRHAFVSGQVYGEVHRIAAASRETSRRTLDGWTFRHELAGGAVREIQVARLGTHAPYLVATDLFANGRFSTMSHTVLMVFPRRTGSGSYRLLEQPSGDVHLYAPDGSLLVVDGGSGGLRPSADYRLGRLGAPGTPPALWHRGSHLRIEAVGRSPFLRNTAVRLEGPEGLVCRLRTDDLFVYDHGPESDVFRFADDAAFASFLVSRCPDFAPPTPPPPAVLPVASTSRATPARREAVRPAPPGPVPLLVPAASPRGPSPIPRSRRWFTPGGLLWQLF